MTGAVPDPCPTGSTDARRISVLTGAGISTDSGIPDYRGPNGVWTRDPDAEKLVTLSYYLADPEIRRRAWLMRRDLQAADVAAQRRRTGAGRPRAARAGCARWSPRTSTGCTRRPVLDRTRVLEIHGTVHEVECLACGDRTTMRARWTGSRRASPTRPAWAAAAS